MSQPNSSVLIFKGTDPISDSANRQASKIAPPENPEGLVVKPDLSSMTTVSSYMEEKMEAADVGMRAISKISIALDELYSNIVHYSCATWAEAICRITNDSITMILRDNGILYNPLLAKEPDTTLSAEERRIGGLGIFMTKKLMNDISYSDANGINEITVRLNR